MYVCVCVLTRCFVMLARNEELVQILTRLVDMTMTTTSFNYSHLLSLVFSHRIHKSKSLYTFPFLSLSLSLSQSILNLS